MNFSRISPTLALCVALLGCEAPTPQGTPAQQHAVTASPTPATQRDGTEDEIMPPGESSSQEHQQDDAHAMPPLDQGQPWATDAPLVQGMERIRDAVNGAAARPALDADSAAALARTVREQVDFLIANCRLEPDADATLHVFIGQFLGAAAALERDPASAKGLPQLQETLREYPKYFAHPGWRTESAREG